MPSRAPKIEVAGGIEEDPVLFDALSFIPLFGLQPGSKWKQGNGRGLLPFIPLVLAAKTPEEKKARKTPSILATPAFRSECLLSETIFIGSYQVPPSVVASEQLTTSALFAGAAGLHLTSAGGATMASVSPPLALRVAFPADGLVAALIAVGTSQPPPGSGPAPAVARLRSSFHVQGRCSVRVTDRANMRRRGQ
ncbi:hypothetical protein ISCGN_010864 [Ixodes scapularis]